MGLPAQELRLRCIPNVHRRPAMHTKVSKWGNSFAVRIPAAIAEQVNITCGGTVDLKVVNGQLVVVPARVHVPTLDELLHELDPGTLHGEVNWGRPVGNGAW